MPEQPSEAVITIGADGRFTDANGAALELLVVSLAELLASPPDRFAIQPTIDAEQAALRAEWEAGGTQLLVGTTGLRRADGTTIRVAYAIEAIESGFRARLWQVDGSPHAPVSAYTVGDVLQEWRAAERELADLLPGSPDWARTLTEIESLRDRYQELSSPRSRHPRTSSTEKQGRDAWPVASCALVSVHGWKPWESSSAARFVLGSWAADSQARLTLIFAVVIDAARRAAVRYSLLDMRMDHPTAERWCDAWEIEAAGCGLQRDADYRTAGAAWIAAECAECAARRPGR
jgi:PAS domain-containing protein